MKLSILIPLYNKEKYIDRCLKSLVLQDLSENDYEIIIVDDGSTDSGTTIAQNFATEYPNIHFHKQPNSGPSVARNKAFDMAQGDYVYFLDADDFLATNVLNGLLDLAIRNDLEILEFNTKEIEAESLIESSSDHISELAAPVMDGIEYIAEYGFRNEAWRYIIKREFLIGTGIKFLEGTLYEDVIFTVSLFLKVKRMSKVELDVHRYVTADNSIVTSKDAAHNLRFIKGMTYAVEKIHDLITGLNSSHEYYQQVVKKLRARQQAFVLALIIRTFKHRLLSLQELDNILVRMNNLDAYPIDRKIGGLENSGLIYNKIFIPISNNKKSLFFCMRLRRLIPSG